LGEPAATLGNTIRIALYVVKPDYEARLIYQLSHELVRVKMGVRSSNYLEQYQDRYTQGMWSSFMLEYSGEVTAT
jgi:hypothetical protein